MKKIRLLIIEDNRLLRDGLAEVLKKESDFEVIAVLQTDEKILSEIKTSDIDVVLLDLGLQSYDSLDVVKRITKDDHEVNIVLMGLFAMHSEVLDFVECGVKGFILKDATVSDFLCTIRSVAKGERVLPAYLTESLFTQIVEQSINTPGAEKRINEAVQMTQREKQVIELIAEGLTNKEIAQKLFISPYTVKSHVHNILEKLTLQSRLQIAKYAHDRASSSTNGRNSG
ncbi:MAG TPA: response regulator transcription factor [Gracilimonas sp.]|uniref:LuxR C-terminal-related transcriptional regulator n=1 Tax=Gracilimonas sp. TaxID=1974203 RepID=UPI002DB492D1|nr:response regulator transcription factor [Gracilimonas sp.]